MMNSSEPSNETLKLAWIIFESGTDAEVTAALEEMGISHYTRFEQVKGQGETGRKEGTAVFPGINIVLMVALPEDKIAPLVQRLHEIRDSFVITPGMKVIVTDCVMF